MGVLVLIVGLGVLGFGFWNHLKGKRILAAPFKGTGELAKDPTSSDPRGAMSTEGKVVPPAQPLLSPCSQTPCISYEVKIERMWEKLETTQDGTKTVKGTDTLTTLKGGAVIKLDDGTGPVEVDLSKGADFDDLKETFKKEINGGNGSSHVQFGDLAYDVPVMSDREKSTVGFRATEKSVAAEGSLFVLGKIEGSRVVKPGWRSMMASSKGRDGLLGSIQKAKKFSFIGGGVVAAASIPVMVFAPAVDSRSLGGCGSELVDAVAKCSDNVSSKEGDSFTWTTTKAGKYEISVIAPKKKIALAPEVVVTGPDGAVLIDESAGVGETVKGTAEVQAGKYTLTVKAGDGFMVKGGYSYDLEIVSLGDAAGMAGGDAPAGAPSGGEAAQGEAAAPDEAAVAPEPVKPAAPMKKPAPVAKKKPLHKK